MRGPVTVLAALLWLIALAAAGAYLADIRMAPETEALLGGPELYDTHFENYRQHQGSTYVHIVFGALLAVLMPIQLSGKVRDRLPSLHRLSGGLFVGAGLMAASTGVHLAMVMPFGGLPETLAVVPMAVLFGACLVQGVRRARQRDFERHRPWMIRAVAIALAVATQRVLFSVAMLLRLWPARRAFWIAIVLAVVINLALAEWLASFDAKRRPMNV
jgi:predicted membrane protein DUF2306